jgi:hypothetical protein
MAPARRFTGYRQFWAFYVGEHRRPATRWLHFAGTTFAIMLVALAIALSQPWLLLACPVAAYGPAWIGHMAVEGNLPATFRYPLRSLIADFHMYGLMWLGRMDAEVDRLSIQSIPGDPDRR